MQCEDNGKLSKKDLTGSSLAYFEEPYHHLPGGTEQNLIKLPES
jgi:hypothetical protein